MVRTFIAVDFDTKQIRENIKKVQQELRSCGADLKLVDPSIIHMTLEFLGELSEKQIEDVINCMSKIVFEPFEVKLQGIGVFPNEKYLKVIYTPAQCKRKNYLSEIQFELHKELETSGFKLEQRPFKPHLTIARVKSARNKKELIALLKKFSNITFGEQTIREIRLKKSVLSPHGPNYTTLFEVKAKE